MEMSKARLIRIVLLIGLGLTVGVLEVSAQGWKECKAQAYKVTIPAGWSCSQSHARSTLVSVSSEENIQLIVSSKPVNPVERLPTDPERLKEYVSDRFDLINSSEDGRFAITTQNIAAERINGLRGVVAELILAKPALKKDGTPFLARFAGFVLIFEKGSMRYSAIILARSNASTTTRW